MTTARDDRPQSLRAVPAVLDEKHRGHLRLAQRFLAQHGDALRHVRDIGWHYWDGSRWMLDAKRIEIESAVATIAAARADLALVAGQASKDLHDDILRAERSSDGMLKFAAGLPPISTAAKELDAHPHLFNTPTGTVHLGTGEVQPNNRADLITKVSGAPLTSTTDAEWDTFIARILPDDEVRAFVQRLFGYAMLGEVTEHVMPIFTGTGANGKGTLRDAIAAAFGDYAIEVDPAILMESKHERHGTFKMRLRGARLVFCSETEKGRRFAEATMKRLVGGDPIEANLMHRDPIAFEPSHTLIMLTNHLPVVSGDDPAVWRRILVVPFDVVIPDAEQDGNLKHRLRKASAAVLAWVHRGWLDYQEEGLNPPAVVKIRTQEYQNASDVLGRFLDERTFKTPQGSVKATPLFNAWSAWCHGNGEQSSIGNATTFAKALKLRGVDKVKRHGVMTYLGLVLAAEDEDDDTD